MSGANKSIVTLYEVEGRTPEQIADIEGFDVAAVKHVLSSYSAKYRADTKQESPKDEFTDDESNLARQAIVAAMQFSDDEHLRLRAATYIRNDKKGRLDVDVNAGKRNNIGGNIVMINQFFALARQRKEEAKNKIIELLPHESALLKAAEAKII